MAQNNFQIWDQPKTNIQSDSTYASDPQRSNGAAVSGLFGSPLANKLFYQLSVMVNALATIMQNKTYDMLDTNPANLQTALSNLLTNHDVPGYLVQWSEVASKIVQFSNYSSGSSPTGFWQKDPTGLIRQWGQINTDINNGQLTVIFPTAFTNASSISVVCTTRGAQNFDRIIYIISGSVSLTGFTVANNGSGGFAYWQSMGY
jgi:hypothetical protein